MTEITHPDYEPTLPQFSERDPRLDGLLTKWNALDTHSKQRIKNVLNTRIANKKNDAIAVRSQDIITTLIQLVDNKIVINDSDGRTEGIMSKRPGWFFTTGIFSNEFYNGAEASFVNPTMIKKGVFNDEVYQNAHDYAAQIAFSTAFFYNVVPFLKPEWQEVIHNDLIEVNDTFKENYSTALLFETYLEILYRQISNLTNNGQNVTNHLNNNINYWAVSRLNSLLTDLVNKPDVLTFLQKVVTQRGGVQVSFGRNLLKNSEASTDGEDFNELIVKPNSGVIELEGTLIAFESLGEYENEILKLFGL